MKDRKVTEVQSTWLYQGPDHCEMTHSVAKETTANIVYLYLIPLWNSHRLPGEICAWLMNSELKTGCTARFEGLSSKKEVQLEVSHSWQTQWANIGATLFTIFINYIDDRTKCTPSNYVNFTRLGRIPDTPKKYAVIQKNLRKLEKWVDRDLMKFSKGKTSGRECHGNVQGPGDWRMMLMDSKLNLSQPYALRAKQASSFFLCCV